MKQETIDRAVAVIRSQTDYIPKVAFILGSGLGSLAEDITDCVRLEYDKIPGFPKLSVAGHAGNLFLGKIGGGVVALLQGRQHFYESGNIGAMNLALATLQALGCTTLLASNASGALAEVLEPGDIALISDHINYAGVSPLIGETFFDDKFIDMRDAYDPELRHLLQHTAQELGFALREAVYTFYPGPQFETPAEIRAIAALGGDLVGMSTVPEVIIARALGMRVAALSVITNKAAGLGTLKLSHAQTQAIAAQATDRMRDLVKSFLKSQSNIMPWKMD